MVTDLTAFTATPTHIYYAVSGTNTIHRAPMAGGAPEMVVVAPALVSTLADDDTTLYFGSLEGTNLNSSIRAVPLAGGTSRLLTDRSGTSPARLVVDATHAYWLTDTALVSGAPPAVHRTPLAGGAVTDIALGRKPFDIAIDATDIYWSEDSNIWKVSKAAAGVAALGDGGIGTGGTLFLEPFGGQLALAMDGDQLYFTKSSLGGLHRVPKAGGTPQMVADSTLASGLMVLDATHVYFATNQGNIFGYNKATGAARIIGRTVNFGRPSMALDSSFLYATTLGGIVKFAR